MPVPGDACLIARSRFPPESYVRVKEQERAFRISRRSLVSGNVDGAAGIDGQAQRLLMTDVRFRVVPHPDDVPFRVVLQRRHVIRHAVASVLRGTGEHEIPQWIELRRADQIVEIPRCAAVTARPEQGAVGEYLNVIQSKPLP